MNNLLITSHMTLLQLPPLNPLVTSNLIVARYFNPDFLLHTTIQTPISKPKNILFALNILNGVKPYPMDFMLLQITKLGLLFHLLMPLTLLLANGYFDLYTKLMAPLTDLKLDLLLKDLTNVLVSNFFVVVKHVTLRLILSVVLWMVHPQLDINNVFLQGTLSEETYLSQSPRCLLLSYVTLLKTPISYRALVGTL